MIYSYEHSWTTQHASNHFTIQNISTFSICTFAIRKISILWIHWPTFSFKWAMKNWKILIEKYQSIEMIVDLVFGLYLKILINCNLIFVFIFCMYFERSRSYQCIIPFDNRCHINVCHAIIFFLFRLSHRSKRMRWDLWRKKNQQTKKK